MSLSFLVAARRAGRAPAEAPIRRRTLEARRRASLLVLALLLVLGLAGCSPDAPPGEEASEEDATVAGRLDEPVVRINLLGYRPEGAKVAVAFGPRPVGGSFSLVETSSEEVVYTGRPEPAEEGGWRDDRSYYRLDFSSVRRPGRYVLRLDSSGVRSPVFRIGEEAYGRPQDDLLGFLRQQRCGYNPFLDVVCHQQDGRSFYGPMPDSTYVEASGGWHDAGDQLKYLLTASNATARLLLAYRLQPDKFGDRVDTWGRPEPNGVPDVLDEARWGLRWLHRLHPGPGQLIHQVADDRDHIGWKWPHRDSSDYGWGPDSYRPAYFATGEPQGLGEYVSRATGIGNLAGRYAAAMASAYEVWKARGDTAFALKCLRAAREVYHMGREDPGFQQGNSYGAPYRYAETTWADDMEWGAAALYRATGEEAYLEHARRYARRIGTTSWIGRDTTEHYQYYPFVNVGHYALYPHVDGAFKDTLAAYYRAGIERVAERARKNVYRVGVPFIWCSNHLVVGLATQILLYEKMTGDTRYRDLLAAHRDWLLGRNPWGTTMFTGIPRDGEHPDDVHTSIYALTGEEVPGGLVDGPVYRTIYAQLRGLSLSEPDEFAAFQTPYVVYHDDIQDYSTNEPTMDGTAGAVYLMSVFGVGADTGS